MARKKKDSDLGIVGASRGIVIGGATLGIGSSIVSGIGGSTAASAQSGLSTAASFMPVAGTAVGAGMTLRQLKKLEKIQKRR